MKHTPRFSQDIADKSFLEVDAICHDQFGDFNKLSSRFSDGMEAEVHPTRGAPRSSTGAILANISSFFHYSRPDNDEATELPQPPTTSELYLCLLLNYLSSLIRRSSPENNEANEFP
ncbi:hypothetical protein BDR05DRAFT_446898 [Suillus weaverae]|nr:hypothetical protein BDR05DRAFT_446898 [Suillus weaverae]